MCLKLLLCLPVILDNVSLIALPVLPGILTKLSLITGVALRVTCASCLRVTRWDNFAMRPNLAHYWDEFKLGVQVTCGDKLSSA